MSKMLLAVAAVCVLAGCSSPTHSAKVDINKVVDVKSSFGPEFKVSDISERGIDPKLLAGRKLPDGLTFEPANCAKVAAGPDMPADLKGNMSAVTAEGRGNRFVVIALETSKALPFNDPGKDCNKVTFTGPQMRGGVQVVDVPQIESTRTLGVHRVMQALTPGGPRTGELYDYSAAFGDYQVIVIANPLVVPNQPVTAVDTQRARDLLVKAVSAVRT
ncbi:DUF5642 family protein [Mycobacterium colombiense]|uniref:DUF5642 domain-containing protein n=1 Tax=Mycobacterium [tuberculosis] TKK-01-0051 TaxID=1324261 RepID=A0A051TQP0_9MYCO|nr:DUF5642 family protein [Mycobacterium colombiense]KBZ59262.1 hypothetical protein K875_04820 [Mycobacterium [tuberculosis] TKK-01-0051]